MTSDQMIVKALDELRLDFRSFVLRFEGKFDALAEDVHAQGADLANIKGRIAAYVAVGGVVAGSVGAYVAHLLGKL